LSRGLVVFVARDSCPARLQESISPFFHGPVKPYQLQSFFKKKNLSTAASVSVADLFIHDVPARRPPVAGVQ
jgi:hypothetical protein